MHIEEIRLHTVRLPLVAPFTTSFSTQTERNALLVEVRGTFRTADGVRDVLGWGECVSGSDPFYSSEYVDGSRHVIEHYLAPALLERQSHTEVTAETVSEILGHVVGHPMAKAALEIAILDAELHGRGESLARYLGATRTSVPSAVSVGIQDSIPELLDRVGGYLDEGYARIKIKIKPGWDIEPVRAIRERFGYRLPLQVDANAAFTLVDAPLLRRLDEFNLLLIEQPLGEADIRQHAKLAAEMSTPMCLDESIVSAESAADAISLGAAAVINIKAGRVGGYLEARKIHDLARALGVAVWCGGMLETGIGRAANIALAALPGFTLPGDISSSSRFYATDITEPFVASGGRMQVPTGPGIGAEPLPEVMREVTTDVRVL
ncbi:o-succinylbenzoate synthase [Spelaeicoccus albus]|uniref:o-succinylbenzoate synthase n=1 Tax=Spelaeicoccus albus TaxID=1280376 RepID=A0A7Z0AD74_9MICO|nr:o-succinylbenzoate synthase [Spelaeicoccus albus]NYI67296.1 O-succinylbenzoate synthase [Spelaeicoccus albus]